MKENLIYDKAFEFAKDIVYLYKELTITKKEFILSKQILRSGTSIGANVREGIHAQSTKDFLSKMNIALKEVGETLYWLELLEETDYINDKRYFGKCNEIYKILSSIVKTTKLKIEN